MKQIIQDLKSGDTILEEVPVPKIKNGHLLIRSTMSLISLGTERMLVQFGKANYFEKARQQPDKVKMVIDKIKADGLRPTIKSIQNKISQPMPLGYCNVGTVVEVGDNLSGFKVGDRVASNGHHAEFVLVPKNLAALIPENVCDQEACFTVIGAIGLQGIRLLNPSFGETYVVMGLGLIGLITAELLVSSGCRVIGFDTEENKIGIAKKKGILAINVLDTDPVKYVHDLTNGIGSDGVVITASSKSDRIIAQSANMCRKRGKIILVGVIGLNIKRADFYDKELTFQVSCSYGPGRYDAEYENKGRDYPLPYVRWTEKRNFQSILEAISNNKLTVENLISDKVKLENVVDVYDGICESKSIAILIQYSTKTPALNCIKFNTNSFDPSKGVVAVIGAGGFTSGTLLPILTKLKYQIKYIVSNGGLSGTLLAKQYKIANSTTDYENVLEDPEIDLVLITTQHDQHSRITIEALKRNKHVFVEKPLAINSDQLDQLLNVYRTHPASLMVGFNRRFSPFVQKMKELIAGSCNRLNMVITVNAGHIPSEMWHQDLEIGGGRIIGEACHFLDLLVFFSESPIKSVIMSGLGENPERNTDNAVIVVKLDNGSQGSINYLSSGHKSYSKERVEIFFSGKTLILDNFKTLRGYGFDSFKKWNKRQNKGHYNQFKLLKQKMQNGDKSLIDFESLVNVTRSSFATVKSLELNTWVDV